MKDLLNEILKGEIMMVAKVDKDEVGDYPVRKSNIKEVYLIQYKNSDQ